VHKPAGWIRIVIIVAVFAIVGYGLGRVTEPATPPADVAGMDLVAEYDAAVAQGRPVYVLIHSETCASCVEMAATAEEVLPEYDGEVEFIDALNGLQGSEELAGRFEANYIPTSVFVDANGEVADFVIGPIEAPDLREELDALAATK
jgi:thioredoxin-like negative regulator of GroEL